MEDHAAQGEVSRVLNAAAAGDPRAAGELLPLVYDQLRVLARQRLAKIPPGNTFDATSLVNEAFLRLVGDGSPVDERWQGRGHFFAAAARAMRNILVEQARRKAAVKHGGGRKRQDLEAVEEEAQLAIEAPELAEVAGVDMISLDGALTRLELKDERKASIVMLRFFAGLTSEQTATALGMDPGLVDREWRYIKAWLHRELRGMNDGAAS